MKNTIPRVGIIMLNYNQWVMTRDCVLSVLDSSYPNFEILVIDNGSNDPEEYRNLKDYESEKCTVVRIHPNRGYVGGMNYGLKWFEEAGVDLFLIMNNDTIIAPDAISKLVEAAKRYKYLCIVTGKVYQYDNPDIIQHIGYRFLNRKTLKMERLLRDEPDTGRWNQEMEMDMIDDIFWLLPRQLYEQIGGYSPYFWFNAEQADLALRAVKQGYKLVYTPEAKLWHKGSVSIGGRDDNPRLLFYNVQATLIIKWMHINKFYFFFFYFNLVINVLKSYFKHLIKRLFGRPTNYDLIMAAFYGIFYFNSWVFKKQVNSGRTPFDK